MEKKEIFNTKEFKKFKVALDGGHLLHAYLVIGEDAKSLEMFVQAISGLLMCESAGPCGECAGCKKHEAGFHPDLFVYPKGKTFLVADSEDILENAYIKPLESDHKVFVVHNIDNATEAAQNKLLKTVEEAPKNVVFIFDTLNENGVLQTIKSRTQIIMLGALEEERLEDRADWGLVDDMLKSMRSSRDTLKYAVKFAEKTGFLERLETLGLGFEKMLYELSSDDGDVSVVGLGYSAGAIAEILDEITMAKRRFEANVSVNLIVDNLLLKILEVRYKWSKN